uniref:4-alpha-glucanotransferase n=1 Tax=Prevotellamassilia timonensis TaxID=1852370 RepID=UPI0040388C20
SSPQRDTYHTAEFRSWPDAPPKPGERAAYTAKHPDVADSRLFYAWLQYLLHRQMQRAHNTARELGVILKGDIPIGISRDSVPAWADGHLFHFDGQAGAPPDDFAVHGQN